MASGVFGAIEPRLRQSEFERTSRKPTERFDAYDLYLRALALRDTHTDEGVREEIALLKRALAIDPDYAPAKAAIGWSHIHQSSHGRTPLTEADRAEAGAFAWQALETGKDDPDVLWMAAATLTIFVGEHAVAATAIDRALTPDPNSAHAGWRAAWCAVIAVNLVPQSKRASAPCGSAARSPPHKTLPPGWPVLIWQLAGTSRL